MIIIHKLLNESGAGGLGDFIRASIYLYYLSKKINFEYYIDLSQNIYIEKCFNYKKIKYNNCKEINLIDNPNSKNILNNLFVNTSQNNSVYVIISNYIDFIYKNELNQLIDDYNTNILKPSKLLSDNINYIMNKYNLSDNNYISCHIRCGDYTLYKSINDINIKERNHRDIRVNINDINTYNNINEFINKNLDMKEKESCKIIIHSDNELFKKKIKELYPKYEILDIKIKHIVKNIGENNIDYYISTLSEFYIISKSKKVLLPISYSGFSHWSSIIGKKELIANFKDNHLNKII